MATTITGTVTEITESTFKGYAVTDYTVTATDGTETVVMVMPTNAMTARYTRPEIGQTVTATGRIRPSDARLAAVATRDDNDQAQYLTIA
jgi:hypothetical protein